MEWTTEGPIDPEKQDETQRPEEMNSHFHPCPNCETPVECFCPFPESNFGDDLALCFDCRNTRSTA
jgi:hypothetical protein